MRLDLWIPTAAPFCTPTLLEALGEEAEARGIARIWVGEHAVQFDQYDSLYPYAKDGKVPMPADIGLLEPLSTLSFLSHVTSTVRLGTAMLLLPQRNPVYVAKEVSTLDWLSKGRIDLGIGVGWLEEEFDVLNVPFVKRGKRTDEYLEVLKALWYEDPSSFTGDCYSLPSCSLYPKPVQQPLPIHIGGESKAAIKRVARFGAGWHTFGRLPEDCVGAIDELNEELEKEGRKRSDVEVTVCPYFHPLDADRFSRYEQAGCDAVAAMLFASSPDDLEAAFDALEPIRERAR
jgi:probable F420-dependent oxidoreductase